MIPRVSPQVDRSLSTGAGIHQKRVEGPALPELPHSPRKAKIAASLDTELALDGTQGTDDTFVLILDQAADLANRAHDRGVIFAAEAFAEFWLAGPEALPADVHRDHTRKAHRAVTAAGLQIGQADAEVAAGDPLNVLDAGLGVLVRDDGAHRLLGEFEVHRKPQELRLHCDS